MGKNVVIRADASNEIGIGHVMRCLNLADVLRARGAQVLFVCRKLDGDLFDHIKERGYEVSQLPQKIDVHEQTIMLSEDAHETVSILKSKGDRVDWLIIDHYAIDANWERELKSSVEKIMVIDGLKNRPHECDLLLDQNDYAVKERHHEQVPSYCRQLLGSRYALLSEEFSKKRMITKRSGLVKRILVTFGGGDINAVTLKALRAIVDLNMKHLEVVVVLGKCSHREDEIRSTLAALPHARTISHASNMADLMIRCDLAIAAGGMTKLELCALGVPSIIVTLANNQRASTEYLGAKGALIYLGHDEEVTSGQILDSFRSLMGDSEKLIRLSKKATSFVDGKGAERVCQELMS